MAEKARPHERQALLDIAATWTQLADSTEAQTMISDGGTTCAPARGAKTRPH
jgi:hypothetical protein